jgi:hypothetical protein
VQEFPRKSELDAQPDLATIWARSHGFHSYLPHGAGSQRPVSSISTRESQIGSPSKARAGQLLCSIEPETSERSYQSKPVRPKVVTKIPWIRGNRKRTIRKE